MRDLLLTISFAALVAGSPAAALTFTTGNQPAIEQDLAARFSTSGQRGALSWTARNTIIGQTPTSDVLPPSNTIGGGNPIYKPSANKNGVVALIMDYGGGRRFICSGSVLADGVSIATAAHCVSSGAGTANPLTTTAYFYNGNPDARTPFQLVGSARTVSNYYVNPGYTGEVIDQTDIAILRLRQGAPALAQRYDLFTETLTGVNFNVAGYGTRSTVGGASGNTPPFGARTGFLREGDNKYDYAWGNPLFDGFFTDLDANGENFFGTADIEFSYISDFDNGLRAQDMSRRIANAIGLGPIGNANFDNTGLGEREVGIAGGDSGGPGFVDGKLASINSYGLSFGQRFGDYDAAFNAGWGEMSGYVPINIHTDFINSAMAVPEPDSWVMLIVGFGLMGATMRRRRAVAAAG